MKLTGKKGMKALTFFVIQKQSNRECPNKIDKVQRNYFIIF